MKIIERNKQSYIMHRSFSLPLLAHHKLNLHVSGRILLFISKSVRHTIHIKRLTSKLCDFVIAVLDVRPVQLLFLVQSWYNQ